MASERHEYKTWPAFFQDVWSGRKRFEIRESRAKTFQRDPEVGDDVRLREFDTAAGKYTGREITVRVIYVIAGGLFGLGSDSIAFGFHHKIERTGGE